jgi:hypothetical protein
MVSRRHRVCDVSDLLEHNVAFHGRHVRCRPAPGSRFQETKMAVSVVVGADRGTVQRPAVPLASDHGRPRSLPRITCRVR